MIDLLRTGLRDRDIRKLVEPRLHEVSWRRPEKSDSEWILADDKGFDDFQRWLSQCDTRPNETVIFTNSSWSHVECLVLSNVMDSKEQYFSSGSCLIVNGNRNWVLQYHDNKIMRYGTWQNGT